MKIQISGPTEVTEDSYCAGEHRPALITRWDPPSACLRSESSSPQQTLTCTGPVILTVVTEGLVRVRPLGGLH